MVVARPAAAASDGFLPRPLGAPYSGWDVTFSSSTNPGVYTLTFDSPLLGKRIVNSVFIPASYSDSGTPSPVMYYLHGTVFPETDIPLLGFVDSLPALALVKAVSTGGGYQQTEIFDFPSQLSRARFVVVAPDTDPAESLCHTCLWADGSAWTGGASTGVLAMPADSFLHEELYPLVQALLNVRTDAGGRGVMGFSMGGWSALLQAEWHPDDYAIAASVSGVIESVRDLVSSPLFEAVGYVRDQGYGLTSATNPVNYAGLDTTDMASNLSTFPGKLLASNGDGCVPLSSLTAPDCVTRSALLNPDASWAELEIQHNNDAYIDTISAAHQLSRFVRPGVHGGNNHTVYAKDILPIANAAFATSLVPPTTFSYKSVFRTFDGWGYDVSVSRSGDAFTNLTDAKLSGASFTISGEGSAVVTTPASFAPATTYTVTVSCSGSPSATSDHLSTAEGRVAVHLDLPSSGSCSVDVLQVR
jgi:hypothetical protein